MADITFLSTTGEDISDEMLLSAVSVATATQEFPLDNKHGQLAGIIIYNQAGAAVSVTLVASTDGGEQAALGSETISVTSASIALLSVKETSRFKLMASDHVVVTITTNGTIGDCDLFGIYL